MATSKDRAHAARSNTASSGSVLRVVGAIGFASAVAVIVFALAIILPRMGESRAARDSVFDSGNTSLQTADVATPYVHIADPATPLGVTQRFVAAYSTHKANIGKDAVRARIEEAEARAFLTPSLNSSAVDLADLGVYTEPGSGDEDGWPEPIRGRGVRNHYTLTVAFDSDAGEVAHGAGGADANITRVMEFSFVQVAGQWKIDSVKRINYSAPSQKEVAPEVTPTVAPAR